MKFQRTLFFTQYHALFQESLNQSQVDGLNGLLDHVEADINMNDIRFIAYFFATIKHECANKYMPVEEVTDGLKYEGRKDLGNVNHGDGPLFKGRGYVQITGRGNYNKFGKIFGIDLVSNPNLALTVENSYKISATGILHGLFTGVGLHNYIHDTHCDYIDCRKTINGLDCAEKIAGYATIFEKIFSGAKV